MVIDTLPRDEGVQYDLSPVEKVAKLSFPYGEVFGAVDWQAVFECHHCFFWQQAVVADQVNPPFGFWFTSLKTKIDLANADKSPFAQATAF